MGLFTSFSSGFSGVFPVNRAFSVLRRKETCGGCLYIDFTNNLQSEQERQINNTKNC